MATIHDVAQDAGVSPTTVSRYLNNRIELPSTTAARIDAAIRRLDYRPNLLAKRLSTGRTEAVGLVTPEIREPFFAELASAFEDEADRHGYTVFISSTRSDRDREIASLKRLHDGHVDGLLMMTNTPTTARSPDSSAAAGTSSSSTRTSPASARRDCSSRTPRAPTRRPGT
jgi:LacI family transcriptional regulator